MWFLKADQLVSSLKIVQTVNTMTDKIHAWNVEQIAQYAQIFQVLALFAPKILHLPLQMLKTVFTVHIQ